jgi:hypothetical protein
LKTFSPSTRLGSLGAAAVPEAMGLADVSGALAAGGGAALPLWPSEPPDFEPHPAAMSAARATAARIHFERDMGALYQLLGAMEIERRSRKLKRQPCESGTFGSFFGAAFSRENRE